MNTGFPPAAARLVRHADGRCSISGALTIAGCAALWRELELAGALREATQADLSAVEAADSAGLALLVAWRAERRRAGGELRFDAVPDRVLALARLTDAESLLSG